MGTSECYPTRCTVFQNVTITSTQPWTAYGVDLTAYGDFAVSPASGPAGSTSVALSYTTYGYGSENGYVLFRQTVVAQGSTVRVPVVIQRRPPVPLSKLD